MEDRTPSPGSTGRGLLRAFGAAHAVARLADIHAPVSQTVSAQHFHGLPLFAHRGDPSLCAGVGAAALLAWVL